MRFNDIVRISGELLGREYSRDDLERGRTHFTGPRAPQVLRRASPEKGGRHRALLDATHMGPRLEVGMLSIEHVEQADRSIRGKRDYSEATLIEPTKKRHGCYQFQSHLLVGHFRHQAFIRSPQANALDPTPTAYPCKDRCVGFMKPAVGSTSPSSTATQMSK
ncbi:hypothetical protein BDW22DRAFT_805509 [Trametopsis cervina]|nr:hypothetical protein BDW22DRAFT_805509 [Trametopsis cervina]